MRLVDCSSVEEALGKTDRVVIYNSDDLLDSTRYRIDGVNSETETVRLSSMEDGTPLVLTFSEISDSGLIYPTLPRDKHLPR